MFRTNSHEILTQKKPDNRTVYIHLLYVRDCINFFCFLNFTTTVSFRLPLPKRGYTYHIKKKEKEKELLIKFPPPKIVKNYSDLIIKQNI